MKIEIINTSDSFKEYINTIFHHTDIPLFESNSMTNSEFFSMIEKRIGLPIGKGAAEYIEHYHKYEDIIHGTTHVVMGSVVIHDYKFGDCISIKEAQLIKKPNYINELLDDTKTATRNVLCEIIGKILKDNKIHKHLATSILEEMEKASK